MSAQPLGAILAGGRSSRFGSDKALATIDGRALLDIVADRLRPQCAEVVVVGRDWPGLRRIEDRPAPGLGPLGGLAGALLFAKFNGFETVLTSGCDLPELPEALAAMLQHPDAVLAHQPTVGWWHAVHSERLTAWLRENDRRSIRAWAAHIGARTVTGPAMANVNRPEDLTGLSRRAGPRSSR